MAPNSRPSLCVSDMHRCTMTGGRSNSMKLCSGLCEAPIPANPLSLHHSSGPAELQILVPGISNAPTWSEVGLGDRTICGPLGYVQGNARDSHLVCLICGPPG